MSSDETEDGGLEETLRTVTPLSSPHSNTEMDVIGWGIFIVMLAVALPVIPIFVVYWALDRVFGASEGRDERAGDELTG